MAEDEDAAGPTAAGESEFIELPLVWVGLDEQPIYAVDQVISQLYQDLFVLTFGMASPPPILGSPQDRLAQAKALAFVRVNPVARLSLTKARMREIVDVLSAQLNKIEMGVNRPEG